VKNSLVRLAALTLPSLALFAAAPGAHAADTRPFYYQPLTLQETFAPPAQVTAADRVQREQALNFYKGLDLDNVKVSGFMASRRSSGAADPATDYRTYVGVRYHDALTESMQLSSHTFYGAGSYDGDNSYADPKSGALPEDVRADGKAVGEWLGSDWQVKTQSSGGHTLQAGLEYRQPVAMHLLEDRHLFGNLASAEDPATAHRSVGLNAGSSIAVAKDVAIHAHVRSSAETSGYDVGLTHQPKSGIRAGASYAVQQISDPLSSPHAPGLERRLARVNVAVPFFSDRFSTAFEVQHNDVESTLIPQGRRDFVVGNLTVASGRLVRHTHLSLGVQNLFDTRGVNDGGVAIPFMPADGRSVRLDLKRMF